MCVQVRAMMTESAFSIEELEELYCLFKVRTNRVTDTKHQSDRTHCDHY